MRAHEQPQPRQRRCGGRARPIILVRQRWRDLATARPRRTTPLEGPRTDRRGEWTHVVTSKTVPKIESLTKSAMVGGRRGEPDDHQAESGSAARRRLSVLPRSPWVLVQALCPSLSTICCCSGYQWTRLRPPRPLLLVRLLRSPRRSSAAPSLLGLARGPPDLLCSMLSALRPSRWLLRLVGQALSLRRSPRRESSSSSPPLLAATSRALPISRAAPCARSHGHAPKRVNAHASLCEAPAPGLRPPSAEPVLDLVSLVSTFAASGAATFPGSLRALATCSSGGGGETRCGGAECPLSRRARVDRLRLLACLPAAALPLAQVPLQAVFGLTLVLPPQTTREGAPRGRQALFQSTLGPRRRAGRSSAGDALSLASLPAQPRAVALDCPVQAKRCTLRCGEKAWA